MTKREFLNAVVAQNEGTEVAEFAAAELVKMDEALARRKSKPTKAQLENAPLKEELLTHLGDTPVLAADLAAAMGEDFTTQKVSALLRQLVKEGRANVTDVLVKGGARKAYTTVAPAEVAVLE